MYRVRVLMLSSLGNSKEIVTLCETKEKSEERVAFYTERFSDKPGFDIFVEEFNDVEK